MCINEIKHGVVVVVVVMRIFVGCNAVTRMEYE